jgi:photosystem II stability/assembly factor-like uncharacterized protein
VVGLLAFVASFAALAGVSSQGVLAADGAWVRQESGTSHKLNRVLFLNDTEGWVVGDDATVLHTTDGGSHWQRVTVPTDPGNDLGGIDFVDQQTGWIVGDHASLLEPPIVLHTSDGGATWTAQPTEPVPDARDGDGFADVDFIDRFNGLVCGLMIDANAAATTNGGDAWMYRHRDGPGYVSLYDIDWLDQNRVVCSGTDALWGGPLFLVSQNGGAGWTTIDAGVEADGGVDRVDFTDSSHGYAFVKEVSEEEGGGPALLKTSDGGVTWEHHYWTEIGLQVSDRPSAIDFVDAKVGWAAGTVPWSLAGSNIWRTTDGGNTWQAEPHVSGMPIGLLSGFTDICFVAANRGWVVGNFGTIFHYAPTGSDTTPPVTTASGYDSDWHNHDIHVDLSVVDTGSGPDRFEVSFDSGSWTPFDVDDYVGITVRAKADHTNDGAHTVSYRGVDKAGNVETAKSCAVKIDTRRPATKAPSSATARRGRTAALRYRVLDTVPNGGTASVTIKVKNRAGNAVRTLKLGLRAVNTAGVLTARFTVPRTWNRGTYRFFVFATDAAGNTQASIPSNRLVVK